MSPVSLTPPGKLLALANRGWGFRHWYRYAYQEVKKASAVLHVPPFEMTNILALVSPRTSVTRSVRVTLQYIAAGTLPKDVIRTTRAALRHYKETGKIRGAKTSAFARALRGDVYAIPLDTWMAIALNANHKKLETQWLRSCCKRRIHYCSYILHISPRQCQAAIWAGTVMKHRQTVPDLGEILRKEVQSYV